MVSSGGCTWEGRVRSLKCPVGLVGIIGLGWWGLGGGGGDKINKLKHVLGAIHDCLGKDGNIIKAYLGWIIILWGDWVCFLEYCHPLGCRTK